MKVYFKDCKLKVLAVMLVLCVPCITGQDGNLVYPYLDQLWRSYTGEGISYQKFYRVTVYSINSPKALVGVFLVNDEVRVAWAYSDYSGSYSKYVVATDYSNRELESLVAALGELEKKHQELNEAKNLENFGKPGDAIDDSNLGLDGLAFTVDVIVKTGEITTFRWSPSGRSEVYNLEIIEKEIIDLWNELPYTKDLPEMQR